LVQALLQTSPGSIRILSCGVANAQEYSRITADIGAGYNNAKLDLGYDSMGINSGTLQAVGVSGGAVHIFQATFDPVLHLTPSTSRLDPGAGIGLGAIGHGKIFMKRSETTCS
jgi:hypothetical protein